MGITKKQHHQICEVVNELKANGCKILTYLNVEVLGVSKHDEILLADRTKITWRSYSEFSTLSGAWEKFVLPRLTLRKYQNLKKEKGFIHCSTKT